MNRLLKLLPPYEKASKVFQEIMKVEQIEFDKLAIDIEDLKRQLNPDTATWGLSILEKELGLPINPDLDAGTRRSLIKSRLLMQPPGSKEKLTAILRSFAKSAESEEIFGEYRFRVILSINDEIGRNMSNIYNILETSKPAHLDYETELRVKQRGAEIMFKSLVAFGESVLLYPKIHTELTDEVKTYNASATSSSDNTVIYPRTTKAIENEGRASAAINNNSTEIITIYPKGVI